MNICNFTNSGQKRYIAGININRGVYLIVLCAFLAILGSITLTSAAYWNTSAPIYHVVTSAVKQRIQTPTPALTPAHTPTPTPSPSPTAPLIPNKPLSYPLFAGNSHLPEIALTFDDGPNPYYTPQVLAVLKQYNVQATFFDVGYLVTDYPDIVRQEYKQGNIVGNHSWSHPQLTRLSASEVLSQLTFASHAIQAAIGVRPAFFRPPYGAFNRIVLHEANQLGVTTVLWDDEAKDWKLPGVSIIVNRILWLAHNGAIILLHDGGGNRSETVAALPIIITTLRTWGYKFVTIQQMVNDLVGSAPQAPNQPTTPTFATVAVPAPLAWRRQPDM